jgi:hypothetical protein
MLQIFHAKWHNRLADGESSKGYDVIAELRGSSFVPRFSEHQQGEYATVRRRNAAAG